MQIADRQKLIPGDMGDTAESSATRRGSGAVTTDEVEATDLLDLGDPVFTRRSGSNAVALIGRSDRCSQPIGVTPADPSPGMERVRVPVHSERRPCVGLAALRGAPGPIPTGRAAPGRPTVSAGHCPGLGRADVAAGWLVEVD